MTNDLSPARLARLKPGVALITVIALALAMVAAGAPEARAAGPYTVGGAITFAPGYGARDFTTPSPVILQSTTNASSYLGTFNSSTGRWTAVNVPEGKYTVRLDPTWISPLGMQYYPGVAVRDQAAVITVNQDISNIDFYLEPKIENPITWPTFFKGGSEVAFIDVGDTVRIEPPVFSTPAMNAGYRWYLDGVLIPGETSVEYTVKPADVGKKLSLGYIAARPGHTPREFRVENIFSISKGTFVIKPVTTTGGDRVGNTVTASTSGWVPEPTQITWRWQRDGVDIPGATGNTYTLKPEDLGTNVKVIATGSREGYFDRENWRTISVKGGSFSASPTPTIEGNAVVGQTVTANIGTWTPTPDSLTYQWYRGGEAIAGATALTYKITAADFDKSLTLRVTAKKTGYENTTKSSGSVYPKRGALVNSAVPSITGTLKPGETLTAKPGTWSPAATYAYQWYRDGNAIGGATKSTYKLPSDARGHSFEVRVAATKTGYFDAFRYSSAVLVPSLFTKAPKPTISGSAYKGAKLTAKPGTWSPAPDSFSYQWYRNGKAISGAKSATYKLVAADSGKSITVKVTAKKSGYETTAKTSAKKVLKKFFTKSPAPKISGTGKVGKTLTAKPGTWSPKPSKFTYQWYRDGKAISKATKSTYKLKAADAGKKITVKVTAKRSGYASTPKTSAAKSVALQTFTKAPAPKISGDPSVGATLTATAGTWSPKPTFTYQWYRGGVAIPGATAKTYVLTDLDAGAKITVKVTGKKTGYKPKSVTSAAVSIPGLPVPK